MASTINVRPSKKLLIVPAILVALLLLYRCLYTQDVGEVIVLRAWGGKLTGYSDTAGFHLKAPWEDKISFDTRNMLINFYMDQGYYYNGGAATGPDVTINDRSGAKADIDIQVVYSLDPSAAMKLYTNYGTQTNYTERYLSNDVRSVAREVSGRFDTLTMLTDRSKYTDAVEKALAEKWTPDGLIVEQVAVQDVRYSDEITNRYSAAQAAEIAIAQARNEQESARVKAETKKVEAEVDAETQVIKAKAEAEANRIIDESLTENVLKQKYYETLQDIGQSGNLIIMPNESNAIVQLPNTKDTKE